ncbi:hypothetical protein FJ434_16450 [Mesorhizobium sp. B2-5-13]|uniref:hypothetical protein n=1 Tax=unclassified Mesorhizobium TaxID=325217 RepID=UPI001129FB82|nr:MULTISPECIES: hypothetical protein [unclassified Mesorhizobium]TPJ85515.1 hypothetical protein FJ434_16450 [Mesorhizobium sp. B2-5-13]TPK39273.1 hypothetical protein FJ560_29410 [Mesorhizobium sp. B2-5-5]
MMAIFNIAGSVCSLAGVIVLFRYGMPYKVRTGGTTNIIIEQIDEEEVALERRYDKYGLGGLILIVLGTGLQIAANLQ